MLSILLFFIIIYTKLYILVEIFFQRIKMFPLILLCVLKKNLGKGRNFLSHIVRHKIATNVYIILKYIYNLFIIIIIMYKNTYYKHYVLKYNIYNMAKNS